MENILNKTIEIEDCNGNTIMTLKIDNNGNIIQLADCDIADIDTTSIRIQKI